MKHLLLTVAILTILTKTSLSQQPQPPKEKQYTLTLTQQDIQIIYTALLKLTGEVADDVKDKIKTQYTIQNKPVQVAQPEKQKLDSIPPKKKP